MCCDGSGDAERDSTWRLPNHEENGSSEERRVERGVEDASRWFDSSRHLAFFSSLAREMSSGFESLDPNRVVLLYFLVSGLDLLDGLHYIDRGVVSDWLTHMLTSSQSLGLSGWRAGPFLGLPYDLEESKCIRQENPILDRLDTPHLAMSYAALATLRILHTDSGGAGEDLSAFCDVPSIRRTIASLQNADGSFRAYGGDSEHDMRFLYCACAIGRFLNCIDAIDADKAEDFITKSQCWDYGFGQGPGQESQGGSTFCGTASLLLLNRLHSFKNCDKLLYWAMNRQVGGYQGRTNKDPDTCYSFWIGSTISMLGASQLADARGTFAFAESCQYKYGGFSKHPDTHPDPLHSYLSMAGLSLLEHPSLRPLDPALNISQRAAGSLATSPVRIWDVNQSKSNLFG